MTEEKRLLKVFLCHAHSDKDAVRALYERLTKDGVDAWLDKAKLLPGQDWEFEIRKAVREADVVVVCLSKDFNRAGFRQKEVRIALDTAMEQPEGETFIIPARLEESDTLESLRKWHWVDLFENDGYEMLMRALRVRADSIGATLQAKRRRLPRIPTAPPKGGKSDVEAPVVPEEEEPQDAKKQATPVEREAPKPSVTAKLKRAPVRLKTEYVVAIIGAGAIIIVAIIGLPLIERMFSQASEPAPTELSSVFTDTKGVEMVLVPEGKFTMGSNSGEADEKPPHEVFLDAFHIDKYEVTNAFYKVCVEAGVCQQPATDRYNNSQYAQHPVVYVDWNMAKEYCEWRGARLPTEAEWEKAARGTDGRTYPWGEGIDCSYANYDDGTKSCVGDTTPVGKYPKGVSPYGAYDMAGNLREWVADWYDPNYYSSSPDTNPPGPANGDSRVWRGGSWVSGVGDLRSADRVRSLPTRASSDLGFRCSRSP
jgi:formylglycine-generating enzyme required for sulfatase activity